MGGMMNKYDFYLEAWKICIETAREIAKMHVKSAK